ncbi:desulfoferrodoxin [Vallitalea pronyensis]|uniref:Desulfoferrodoxin n=1 Tax=Vallitalea pronyensis TaxID=1348613 RepID=A0A8J8SG72_9FIRM|nr:desulfoferrodoxin [Vallitalea pronyensis]QUI22003.1 desulfoferrodoxin [Vallitalea pronyensis]
MTKKLEIYRCTHCGNIIEIMIGNGAPIVCCGEKMELLKEQTADTSMEKHVPFIEETEDGYTVRIGENQEHPMNEDHYIQFIELVAGHHIYRQDLSPTDKPIATFKVPKADQVSAREYCNIHGLWRKDL